MNESNNLFFTVGEFAELFSVGKDTLIHYDDAGVFSPAHRGDNGYRYYSVRQTDTFNAILALKETGMSLCDIKSYMDGRSPEKFIALMDERIAETDRNIQRLKRLRATLSERRALTSESLSRGEGVTFFDLPEEKLIVTPMIEADTEQMTLALSISAHLRSMLKNGVRGTYAIGGLLRAEDAGQDPPKYSALYSPAAGADSGGAEIKPAGKYAVYFHPFGYDNVCEAYSNIFRFLASHGLTATGYFYEDTAIDELCVRGYDNYVLKISVRVKNTESDLK